MNIAEKLTAIAENGQKVYEAGKTAEYERFWDNFFSTFTGQNGFSGTGWNNETFKPDRVIKPLTANMLFYQSKIEGDLTEMATIDFSIADSFSNCFANSSFTKIGVIDTRNATNLTQAFASSTLVTIEELILSDEPKQQANIYTFNTTRNLENIKISGKIAVGEWNFSYSTKLTNDSLMSIINALYDYSGTGTTHTCTFGATNLAKLTDAEKAVATQKGWTLV